MAVKILAFAGSIRKDSYNAKLARLAARGAEAAGAEVTVLDLRDYPMPLYDGDMEAGDGPPENAFRLQELIHGYQGLLIASPEYNNSIPALLKNTIDWVSRTPRVRGSNPFAGKVVGLFSASPGNLGGMRGLDHVRRVMATVGGLVLSDIASVPHADTAFNEDGTLKDAHAGERVARLAAEVARVAGKLNG